MKIVTEKVVERVKETQEVVYTLPKEVFCYQRWNYREIVKVTPIVLDKGIVGYVLLHAEGKKILNETLWRYQIEDLFKDGRNLSAEDKNIKSVIIEVSEDINREGSYLSKITEKTFNEYLTGFLVNLLDKSEIGLEVIGKDLKTK